MSSVPAISSQVAAPPPPDRARACRSLLIGRSRRQNGPVARLFAAAHCPSTGPRRKRACKFLLFLRAAECRAWRTAQTRYIYQWKCKRARLRGRPVAPRKPLSFQRKGGRLASVHRSTGGKRTMPYQPDNNREQYPMEPACALDECGRQRQRLRRRLAGEEARPRPAASSPRAGPFHC